MSDDKLPKLYKDPCQWAAGYSLDLYCDHYIPDDYTHNNFMTNFFGESFADTSRQARAAGWKLHRATCTATCPKCITLTQEGQMNTVTLTNAELRLLIELLSIDPGPLGLTNAQAVTARNLRKKLKEQK